MARLHEEDGPRRRGGPRSGREGFASRTPRARRRPAEQCACFDEAGVGRPAVVHVGLLVGVGGRRPIVVRSTRRPVALITNRGAVISTWRGRSRRRTRCWRGAGGRSTAARSRDPPARRPRLREPLADERSRAQPVRSRTSEAGLKSTSISMAPAAALACGQGDSNDRAIVGVVVVGMPKVIAGRGRGRPRAESR
jgi:hypothetical protein